ncbi:hypothetical protein WJX79_002453 [Trebouxia sp. C0005]|nr:MAG: hypothetical protein FRX49_09359 [Trebouxia sp. A1-2]
MQTEPAGSFAKNVTPSAEMVEVLVDGARYGDIEDVQSALQHSVDVNATDSSGRTALHMAAANNHADVAETLIEAGADVDTRNAEGNTPLHWACLNGCSAVAKVLLDKGANPACLNRHSNTPVDELLGKPYQDEMLTLIASYQEQTGRKDSTVAIEDNDDEFAEAEQS